MNMNTSTSTADLTDREQSAALAEHLRTHRIGAPADTDLELLQALHTLAHCS